jgi:hypothetical protein
MNALRRVEKYIPSLEYIEIQFKDLKKGDEFRLFESTGEPVVWDGETEFVAESDAYQTWCEEDNHNPAGYRWTVDTIKKNEQVEV